MFGTIIGSILAWIAENTIDRLFGFGKSKDERLGIAETQAKMDEAILKEVQNAQNLATKFDNMSDSQLRLLTGQWERSDKR